MNTTPHLCEGYAPSEDAGPAITRCFEYDDQPGAFYAGNGEYTSQVAFCPYCGIAAKVFPILEQKTKTTQ